MLYHLAQFRYSFAFFLTGRGDGRFVTYINEHWYQSLAGRAPLLSPRFFYPVAGTLGYSEALVGYALPYSLLRALGLEMFSAMQAVVIVFNFVAFLTAFLLLHRVLRLHAFASGAAAFFFAFSSPKFIQHGHLQMQFTLLLPLLFALPILFARDAVDRGRKRAFGLLALFVLAFHLQLLTTFYYAWFFAFWSLLFVATSLLFASTRRFLVELVRGSWPAIAGALCLALAGSLPFLAIYLPAMRATTPYSYQDLVPMIPAPRNFLDMGRNNRVWGELSDALRPSPLTPYYGELRVGIGLIPTLAWIGLTLFAVAAVAGLFRSRAVNDGRRQRPTRRQCGELFMVAMILATGVFIAMGMKYGDSASPWRLVHAFFPGADAVRAVARYVNFLTLPMAVGFAWAIDRALRWTAERRRPKVALGAYGAIALLAFFGGCEQLGYNRGFSKAAERAYLEELAAGLPPDCEAFHLAAPRPGTSLAEHQYDAMMVSILTGVPTINGLSARSPPGWNLWVTDPAVYDANVRDWIARERIAGKVCRLEIAMPIERVEIGVGALLRAAIVARTKP